MSEDRTQAPTKQRRQLAREQGQAAHSPELTAAAGLLGAALVVSWRGPALAEALLAMVRRPLPVSGGLAIGADGVTAHLRGLALAVAGPLGLTLGGFLVAALAVHLAQVQWLWAPGLLAPDPSRLWRPGQGPGPAARVGRGAWSLVKGLVVAAVAAWFVQARWPELVHLAGLDVPRLARASAELSVRLLLVLAAVVVSLGAVDFGLQYRRFETMLRLTPEQHREDLRSTEGDPVLRSRRRRVAQAMREGTAEPIRGASLVLTGTSGLSVVLTGGPPPRPVAVRAVVNGAAGARLRRAAEEARVPVVAAPDLARRLARRRPLVLDPPSRLLDELAPIWPATR